MNKNVSILAATAIMFSMAAPAFAQTSANDGSPGSKATLSDGGTGTDPSTSANDGSPGSKATLSNGTNFDADNDGQISLNEFNTGISGQNDEQRQQSMRDLGDQRFKSLMDECKDTSADVAATCDALRAYKPM